MDDEGSESDGAEAMWIEKLRARVEVRARDGGNGDYDAEGAVAATDEHNRTTHRTS
jgi:hypothetical protein